LLGSGAFGGGGGSGAGGGYGGFGGGGGTGGAGGFASELESLQRLEELQRRQRLLQAAAASEQGAGSGASRPNAALERALAGMGAGGGREDSVSSPSQRPKPDGVHPGLGVLEAATNGMGAGGPTKEDLEKTPGSVIVPCRARGMPMDHNFKVRKSLRIAHVC